MHVVVFMPTFHLYVLQHTNRKVGMFSFTPHPYHPSEKCESSLIVTRILHVLYQIRHRRDDPFAYTFAPCGSRTAVGARDERGRDKKAPGFDYSCTLC
jgi:hypothetical protein